jgi:hypothetical protein
LDPVGSSAKSHESKKFENEEEQVNESWFASWELHLAY